MQYPDSLSPNDTQPMTKDSCHIFVTAVMAETSDPKFKEPYTGDGEDLGFLGKIVLKRIQVMKLPISFSFGALLSIDSFCDRPGAAVILLADCLKAYQGKTVTTDDLANLYPLGFYNEASLINIIDHHMKPKSHPWAHIY